MPDIPLPKFDDNYQDWYMLKYQFKILISSNHKLNDTQKLYCLKSILSHAALDVVSADDSFKKLFPALEFRFGYFSFCHQCCKIIVFESFNASNMFL